MARYYTLKELEKIKVRKEKTKAKIERQKLILEKIVGLVEQGVFDKQPKMISCRMLRIDHKKRKILKELIEDLIFEEWKVK